MPKPTQHAFSEKVALIAGASGVVGRAVAIQLALYGCYVIATTVRGGDEDTETLSELKDLGTLAHTYSADLADPLSVKGLLGFVRDEYDRLDILVNCSQHSIREPVEDENGDSFAAVVNGHLAPAFLLVEHSRALMEPRPSPGIVNVVPSPKVMKSLEGSLISATSAGVIGLTRSLVGALPRHFRVNAVEVSTPPDGIEGAGVPDHGLFRADPGIRTDHVARAVVFLLSPEAKGLNGQVLKVG